MANPISPNSLNPIGPLGPPGVSRPTSVPKTAGDDFASLVKEQLRKVSEMQSEADQNVQKLLAGETESLTEVFTAARKAEVAFGLLMEIRNKLIDAYQEVKNMRV